VITVQTRRKAVMVPDLNSLESLMCDSMCQICGLDGQYFWSIYAVRVCLCDRGAWNMAALEWA